MTPREHRTDSSSGSTDFWPNPPREGESGATATAPDTLVWADGLSDLLDICPRAAHWSLAGSRPEPGAGEGAIAQPLLRLTDLRTVLSSLLSQKAAEIALALRDNLPRPTREEVDGCIRKELNRVCFTKADSNPSGSSPMLRTTFLADDEGYTRECNEVKEQLEAVTRHLAEAPLWSEIEDLEPRDPGEQRPRDLLVETPPVRFQLPGDGAAPVRVSLSFPVIASLPPRGGVQIVLPHGPFDSALAVERRLALTALYLDRGRGLRRDEWTGRVIDLATGAEDPRPVPADLLDRAEQRVRTGAELLRDVLVRRGQPPEEIPGAQDPAVCGRCPFAGLCHSDRLRAAA